MATTNPPRLAVLIDSDNATASLTTELLAEIAKHGTPTIKRAYGDWTTQNLVGWKEELLRHAIQPVQQFAYTRGKNSTDSALIIDAMDLLYAGNLEGFVLVSSDSDFTRLATRLRESGMTVFGLGRRTTPAPFVAACDRFIYLDLLRAEPQAPAAKGEAPAPSPLNLQQVLSAAISSTSKDDGWSNLSEVGSYLSKSHAAFDPRDYGHSKLGELVHAEPYVDVKEVPGPTGLNQLWVRLKPATRKKPKPKAEGEGQTWISGRRARLTDDAACRPGDGARCAGKQGAAALAQRRPRVLVEPGDVLPGRPDAEQERLPPRLEARGLERRLELGRHDVLQAGLAEQIREVALARARESRFVAGVGIEFARRAPEHRERGALTGVIPDAGRDHATWAGHARHLAQPGDRVAHEVHDELGEGGVEALVGERQRLGRRLRGLDARQALAQRVDERRRRVDGDHRRGTQTLDQLGAERARPAADVEDPLSGGDAGQVGQLRRERARVAPHEAIVGGSGDVETHPANVTDVTRFELARNA